MYPDLKALMPTVPNYQGMFLRGHGSQSFVQNNGTTIGKTITVHSSSILGEIQGDAIRNIPGSFGQDGGTSHSGAFYHDNFIGYENLRVTDRWSGSKIFDPSRVVPTSNENRPINIAVKYLIKAE